MLGKRAKHKKEMSDLKDKTLDELIEDAVNDAKSTIGHVNILIAGKTGIGKSTLVNRFFGFNDAKVGEGKPLTQNIKEYTIKESPYSIFDTKGIELENAMGMIADLKREIEKRKTSSPKEHIHVLWYCLSYEGARFEDCEVQFVQEISKLIPVVVVLTKCISPNEKFFNDAKEAFTDANAVVRILAEPYKTWNDIIPEFGLKDLLCETVIVLPEAAKIALNAAQVVDFDAKISTAKKIVWGTAAGAAGVGAVPIPFSDATLLVPMQLGMLASITKIMGGNVSSGFFKMLIGAVVAQGGVTMVAKVIVGGLLKLIPGAGSVAGGAVSTVVAGTITFTLGSAYIMALESSIRGGKELIPAEFLEVFKEILKTQTFTFSSVNKENNKIYYPESYKENVP